jgi:hypothetical protein
LGAFDLGAALGKPLLLLQLDALPGRIAEDHIEAPVPAMCLVVRRGVPGGDAKDVGKLQVPMEELILGRESLDLSAHPVRTLVRRLLQAPKRRLREQIEKDGILVLLPDECGAPGIGHQMAVAALLGACDRGVDASLLADAADVLVGDAVHPTDRVAELAEP